MKISKLLSLLIASSILFIASACERNVTIKTVKQFPKIEEVAKEHAQQFINLPTEGMNTQQKLFEVRAHEQDLRKEGMSEEADYYIKMFEKHLNDCNPELAKLIIKK